MKRRAFDAIAALIFLGFAVYEFLHDISGAVWPGLYPAVNLVGFFYVPLWLAAGIGLLRNSSWGTVVGILSSMLLLVHGLGINAGGSKQGVPFAFAAVAATLLMGLGKPWRAATKGKASEREDQKAA